MAQINSFGFTEDPFAYTNADEEERLSSYFVKPPYFESVTGDSNAPSTCVVLAPRGAGKSAQRRMTEEWCLKNKVLPVTYDRFEFSQGVGVREISLSYHLRNIITRALLNLMIFASENPEKIKSLPKEQRRVLNILCHNYLGDMTGQDVEDAINNIKSFPQKLKDFWNRNVGFLDSLLNFVLKTFELEKIDLPAARQEEKKLNSSYKYQLETIYSIARAFGFSSIYILIDKVDETELTGNNPENSFVLIEPLIRDLEILSLKGYGFKFFLWDQIYPFFKEAARPDRVSQYSLTWTRGQLKSMLGERLKAFSNDKVLSLDDLINDRLLTQLDDIVTIMGWYSPRNVIRFCQEIMAEQFQINPESDKISRRAIELAGSKFFEKLATEQYKFESLRSLKKIDKELFSINYLASNIFKSSGTNARNKVIGFEKNGAIKKIGKERIESSNKPVNLYLIIDPRLNRIINSKSPMDKFISDRLIVCKECNRESLIDVKHINQNCEVHCWYCDMELFSIDSVEENQNRNAIVKEIRDEIAKNRIKDAIELLLVSFREDKEVYEEGIVLMSMLNRLELEERVSILSSDDSHRQRNRLVFNLLELLGRIE